MCLWYGVVVVTHFGGSARISVEVDSELHRRAKSKAALDGESLAAVVRRLLAGWAGDGLVGPSVSPQNGPASQEEPGGRTVGHSVLRAAGSPALGSSSPSFRPAKAEKFVRCEIRHPMVPLSKCEFEMGHAGEHSWKT